MIKNLFAIIHLSYVLNIGDVALQEIAWTHYNVYSLDDQDSLDMDISTRSLGARTYAHWKFSRINNV